jgi:hypothetical protein
VPKKLRSDFFRSLLKPLRHTGPKSSPSCGQGHTRCRARGRQERINASVLSAKAQVQSDAKLK